MATGFSTGAKGTTTAEFLKLGVGARAAAMGEAYSAVADEASALYWNPGALTRVSSKSATFMHAAYIDSSYFDYGAFAQNLGRFGAWGAGVQFLSAGSITQTDDTGADVGSFTPNDLAVSLGYACQLRGFEFPSDLNGLSIGISGKFIQSKILNTARTGAADLGILSPGYLHDRLRFAFTAANVGGKMKFEQQADELPLTFRFGSAYKLLNRWTLALDIGAPRDNGMFAAMGTEYIWPVSDRVQLAGRVGFNSRTLGDADGFTGVSFGFGFAFQRLGVDYALVPLGGLGQAHRISLNLKL